MSVPSDTLSDDVLELPNWYCMKCKSLLKGEIDEDIFLAVCRCERKWYVQIPRRAAYYLEAGRKPDNEKKVVPNK